MISILKKIFSNKSNARDSTNATKEIIKSWIDNGKPSPPPHAVKQLLIKDAKRKFGHNILIETGTYLGETVEAQKDNFVHVYSIELGELLYQDAVKRFEKDKNVTILHGDSGKVLFKLMPQINEPAIFWLDGHYSAGITAMGDKQCPIFEELAAIFVDKSFNHILLIDDARLFVGKDDYPTIDELSAYIKSEKPNADIYVKHDAIHAILK